MGVGKSTKLRADTMGQCHNFFPCHTPDGGANYNKNPDNCDKKMVVPSDTIPTFRRESDPPFLSLKESGNDSGRSSVESLSMTNKDSRGPRCSHSSESSGKFSGRGSIGSHCDSDMHHKSLLKGSHCDDLPVFEEKGETLELPAPENISRQNRGSRSSCSSAGSIGSFFFRSKKYSRWFKNTEGVKLEKERPRRAVSLRLPRSRYNKDLETKVPTVYIEDEDMNRRRVSRKTSLRKALSLLSLNSLMRENSRSRCSAGRPQKQAQKILRRPTKRHTTVRGISGLAIDAYSQAEQGTGIQTIMYYPTNTSLKTNYRTTYSS